MKTAPRKNIRNLKRVDNQKQRGRVVSVDEFFDNLSDAQGQGLLDAAMEIAERRSAESRKIRDLLIAGQDAEALKRMRTHLGLCSNPRGRRLKPDTPEVTDDVLLSLALELEREQEETLQRLFNAVESDDYTTAKSIVKKLKGE